MPKLFALAPLAVSPAERDAAFAVLDALSRARIATLGALRSFALTEGLTPEILETWTALRLIARATAVDDALRGTTVEVVALTPLGARALSAAGRPRPCVSPARLRRSGQKLAHDAGVGDVALAFLLAGRVGIAPVLGVETDDRRLASSAVLVGARGALRVPLQADAYVLLQGPHGKVGFLVEYDRATISAKRMTAKYAAYAAWRRAGGPARTFSVKGIRVLTIVPDAKRLAQLHDDALAAIGGPSAFFLFAEDTSITCADPARLLEPVARELGRHTQVPLVVRPPPPAAMPEAPATGDRPDV